MSTHQKLLPEEALYKRSRISCQMEARRVKSPVPSFPPWSTLDSKEQDYYRARVVAQKQNYSAYRKDMKDGNA